MPKGTLTIAKEHQECKDGKCGHPHTFDIDLPEVETHTPANITIKEPKPEIQTKVEEKIITKVKAPKDQPYFKCKDCGDKHPNPNYSEKPNKKCPNCGSLNGQKNCKNCNTETDIDDWEELSDEELEELGVPLPEIHKDHDHEHDSE